MGLFQPIEIDDPSGARDPGMIGCDLTVEASGVAWLRLRGEGAALRLGIDALRSMEARIARAETLVAEGEIRALVVATDGRRDVAGYDPDEVQGFTEEELVAWSHEAQVILRRLEDLPLPTVAAIEGRWYGAGAELALAARYRVASGIGGGRVGLPQVRDGFLPAWGGTVRLPRLIGLERSLRLILSGELLGADDARRIGLIDRVFPVGDFEARVERFALRRAGGQSARGGHRWPGNQLLERTSAGRRLAARRASRRHLEADGDDPAIRSALELIVQSVTMPVERAFARESAVAGELFRAAGTRGRLYLERIAAGARQASPASSGVEVAAVLGTDRTASDVAHLLTGAGIPVRVRGADRAAVREGVQRVRERLSWERSHGRITAVEAEQRAECLAGVTGFGGFGTVDIVVAAADGPDEVVGALAEVAEHVRADCVLAYHHWTRSPTAVQREIRNPERVIGMSPAFPSDRFPLLEVAPGAQTTPATVATVRHLATRIGMVPVIVSDQTPTPGSRLLGVFFAEGSRLLAEGATVGQVDAAMEDFGFTLGPFHRVDGIGSQRVVEFLEQLSAVFGERMEPAPLFARFARRAETFYRYRNGVPAGPNPDLPAGLSPGGRAVTDLIRKRILFLLIEEAARIVASGSVGKSEDLDLISVLGLGFPRERGGILFDAEQRGLASVVDELAGAANRYGERYGPAGILRELAQTGRGFHTTVERPTSGQDDHRVLR